MSLRSSVCVTKSFEEGKYGLFTASLAMVA